jgi:peptide/nickel transport system substrate-binding protein
MKTSGSGTGTAYVDWLTERLTLGHISRRQFIGQAIAFGLTAAAANSLAGRAAQAATPKSGGHMKLAMGHGSTTDTIDPAIIENGFQWVMMYAIANPLTEVAPDGSLRPALAESWDVSDDAKAWSFKLRRGVEFQDGRPFTSRDVIANINYHLGDESRSVAKPIVAQIADIQADGDHEVVVTLHSGNADFPFSLTSGNLAMFPANDEGGIDWEGGNGTGGYRLTSFEPGVRAQFERNPNYWKDDAAYVDSAELLAIVDASARTNALITGAVHAIDQVDLKTALLLARTPDIFVEETTGPLHYVFPMQTKVAPFDNPHVRQALKFALDREEMLQKILKGHGAIGNDHPIGPSYRFHADDLEQNGYDPEQAKWHLQQAGLSELTVDLSTADAAFAGAVDAVALYQESARSAGININIVREADDGYWSNVWGKKPWCASYWGGYTTSDEMFTTGYATGGAWNDTQWDQENFQAIMVKARAETDEEERRNLYRELQRILRDEGGVVVPMFANAVFARRAEIEHPEQVSALRAFDGRQIIERWWMA